MCHGAIVEQCAAARAGRTIRIRRQAIDPTVSVIIPTYGDLDSAVDGLKAVLASEGVVIDVVVVNNDPAQDAAAAIGGLGERARVIDIGHNVGFMGAINRGIAATVGEFVLFHNADLIVAPTYLADLTAFMRAQTDTGCATGKLLRLGLDNLPDGRIDTAGCSVRRNRHSFDRGEGEVDRGQFDSPEEVFSVSGAALLARRAALEDVAIDGRYLDERFFMYRDDYDLGWRMRLRGWECWYVPAAVGYHTRSGRGLGGRGYLRGFRDYVRNERRKGRNVRLHSMKNQWLVLLKNDAPRPLLRDLPFIFGREALVFGANLATSPRLVLSALTLFAQAAPDALRDRRIIQSRATVPPAELRRRWFRS